MLETIAWKNRSPYTVRANHACSGGGSTAVSPAITNRPPSARVGERSRPVRRAVAASRSASGIGPSGRSSMTAAVTLPSAVLPVPRIISGTDVRSTGGRSSTRSRARRSDPATTLSRTSLTRTPCSRAAALSRASGTPAVAKRRSPSNPVPGNR
jgi:hypothetical protein